MASQARIAEVAADKDRLREGEAPNLAIVTAYNDMLSARQPYECFPALIREAAQPYCARSG